jgi:predicted unusual protein kinase regulating ubiquinone biosynthesis (AarF/ABC1/UbiB family)
MLKFIINMIVAATLISMSLNHGFAADDGRVQSKALNGSLKQDPGALRVHHDSPFYQQVLSSYETLWAKSIEAMQTWVAKNPDHLTPSELEGVKKQIDWRVQVGPPALELISGDSFVGFFDRSAKSPSESFERGAVVLSTGMMGLGNYQIDIVSSVLIHELLHSLQSHEILDNRRFAEDHADALVSQVMQLASLNPEGYSTLFQLFDAAEAEVKKHFESSEGSSTPLTLEKYFSFRDVHRMNHIRIRKIQESVQARKGLDWSHCFDARLARIVIKDAEIANAWTKLEQDLPKLSYQQIKVAIADVYVAEDEGQSESELAEDGIYQPLFAILWQLARDRVHDKDSFLGFVDFLHSLGDVFKTEIGVPLFDPLKTIDHLTLKMLTRLDVNRDNVMSLSFREAYLRLEYELLRALLSGRKHEDVFANNQMKETTEIIRWFSEQLDESASPFGMEKVDSGSVMKSDVPGLRTHDAVVALILDSIVNLSRSDDKIIEYLVSIISLPPSERMEFESPILNAMRTHRILRQNSEIVDSRSPADLAMSKQLFVSLIADSLRLIEFLMVRPMLSFDSDMSDINPARGYADSIYSSKLISRSLSNQDKEQFLEKYLQDLYKYKPLADYSRLDFEYDGRDLYEGLRNTVIRSNAYFDTMHLALANSTTKVKRADAPRLFWSLDISPAIDEIDLVDFPSTNIYRDMLLSKPISMTAKKAVTERKKFKADVYHFGMGYVGAKDYDLKAAKKRFDDLVKEISLSILEGRDIGNAFKEEMIDILDLYGGRDIYGASDEKFRKYKKAASYTISFLKFIEQTKVQTDVAQLCPGLSDADCLKKIATLLPQHKLLSDLNIDGFYSLTLNHPKLGEEVLLKEHSSRFQRDVLAYFESRKAYQSRSFAEKLEILKALTSHGNNSLDLDKLANDLWLKSPISDLSSFAASESEQLGSILNNMYLSPIAKWEAAARVSTVLDSDELRRKFFLKLSLRERRIYDDLWNRYFDHPELPAKDAAIDQSRFDYIKSSFRYSKDKKTNGAIESANIWTSVFHAIDLGVSELSSEEALILVRYLSDQSSFPLTESAREKINLSISGKTPYGAFDSVKVMSALFQSLDREKKIEFLSYILWSHPSALYDVDVLKSVASHNPLFSDEAVPELESVKTIFWNNLSFRERAIVLSQSMVMQYRGDFFSNHAFILECLEIMEVVGRKLAQLLTTHGTFVPEDLRARMTVFRDQNKHTGRLDLISSVIASIESHHQRSIWDSVSSFGRILNAGSMKTPIEATTTTREKVVIKQLDPIVVARVNRNLELLESAVSQWSVNSRYSGSIINILKKLRINIQDELSIERETFNTKRHSDLQMARGTTASVLEVVDALSSADMTTVKFIDNIGNVNELKDIPPASTQSIIEEVLTQLASDHFVHGDLQNPANILIAADGKPVFIDLSLSRDVHEEDVLLMIKLHETLLGFETKLEADLTLYEKVKYAVKLASVDKTLELVRTKYPDDYEAIFDLIDLITEPIDASKDDKDWQLRLIGALSEASVFSLQSLILEMERAGRAFKDRYLFLIELMMITHSYQSRINETQTAKDAVAAMMKGLHSKLSPSAKNFVSARTLREHVEACSRSFDHQSK